MDDQETIQAAIKQHLDSLNSVREELRLQMSLAKAEIRAEWDQLERRFEKAQEQCQRVQLHAEPGLKKLEADLRALGTELKHGYEAVRRSLQA